MGPIWCFRSLFLALSVPLPDVALLFWDRELALYMEPEMQVHQEFTASERSSLLCLPFLLLQFLTFSAVLADWKCIQHLHWTVTKYCSWVMICQSTSSWMWLHFHVCNFTFIFTPNFICLLFPTQYGELLQFFTQSPHLHSPRQFCNPQIACLLQLTQQYLEQHQCAHACLWNSTSLCCEK